MSDNAKWPCGPDGGELEHLRAEAERLMQLAVMRGIETDDAILRAEAAEAKLAIARQVLAEAYQMAGAVGAPVDVLDNLLDAASGKPLRHETFLPFGECGLARKLKAAEAKLAAAMGEVTPCLDCDGSGRNAHGDCCRIPGHSKVCACVLCQWKNALYASEKREREMEEKLAINAAAVQTLEREIGVIAEERDKAEAKLAAVPSPEKLREMALFIDPNTSKRWNPEPSRAWAAELRALADKLEAKP